MDEDGGFPCEFSGVDVEYMKRTASDFFLGRQRVKVTMSWTGAYPNDPIGRRSTHMAYYWFLACYGRIVPDDSKPQPVVP